ncbi:MAG: YjgN family protein, partial [Deltaproteobacteria bacterium]
LNPSGEIMAEESGKIDQETSGDDPTQAELLEGSDSLTQRLNSSVDEGVASEVLEDPSTLKNWDASPLPFEFTGKAKEFFGIWFSNLLLSILTLGIYSAWAKVRRRRFFLGHTLIGGHRFDYHADPKVILKGRAIVVSVLVVMSLVSELSTVLSGTSLVLLMLALPWLANRSLRFNARMTSFRNVRFDFSGTYGKSLLAFVLFPLLGLLSLGLLQPFATRYSGRYLAMNYSYGEAKLESDPQLKRLYKGFFQAFSIILIPFAVLLGIVAQHDWDLERLVLVPIDGATGWLIDFSPFALIIALYLAFFHYRAVARNSILGSLSISGFHQLKSEISGFRLAWIVLSNSFLTLSSFGLLQPWGAVRRWRYETESLQLIPGGSLDEFIGRIQPAEGVIGSEYTDLQDIDVGI